MKVSDYKLVQVLWIDAESHPDWRELSEVIADGTLECISVGWLVSEREDRIVLVASVDLGDDGEMVASHITIPRSALKEIKELTIKKSRKIKEKPVIDQTP